MIVFFFLLEDVEDWAFDASLLRPWEAHVWGQLLVASQRMGGMSGVFPHTLLRLAPSYHQHQFRICPLLRDFEGHHFRSNSSAVCVVIARWIFKRRRRGRRTVEFCQVTGFLTSGVLKGLGDHPLLSDSVIISDWPSTGGEFLDFKEVKVREIGRQQEGSFFFS